MRLLEKRVEDYIVENPQCLYDCDEVPLTILGQQVPVGHGIIDLLAWDCKVSVIEVKAIEIQEKDVGQVLRYTSDIRDIFQDIGCSPPPDDFDDLEYFWLWGKVTGAISLINSVYEPAVKPVLVGPSISRQARAAASGAGCDIFYWKYSDGDFTFDLDYGYPPSDTEQYRTANWTKTLLGLMRKQCLDERMKLLMGPSPDFQAYIAWKFRIPGSGFQKNYRRQFLSRFSRKEILINMEVQDWV